MKNFTTGLLSFYKSVVFNLKQNQTETKSETNTAFNYFANRSVIILTRIFLCSFSGFFSNSFRTFGGQLISLRKSATILDRLLNHLNLGTERPVYPGFENSSIASRTNIGVLAAQ